jgi:hypothetical protein
LTPFSRAPKGQDETTLHDRQQNALLHFTAGAHRMRRSKLRSPTMPPRLPAAALALALVLCASLRLGASTAPPATEAPPPRDLSTAQAEALSALDLVPARAPIIVLVPSLGALHSRLSAMADAVGLDAVPYNDLLGALRRELGWTSGLRLDGPLVAWLDPFGETTGPIVVVPVSDYAAFLGGLGAVPAPGGVTALPPTSGYLSHAREVPGYAVLGPSAREVEAVVLPPPSSLTTSLGALGLTAAARAEAALILNVEVLSPMLLPLVNSMFGAWEAMLHDPSLPPESRASMEAVINAYRYVVNVTLTETRTSVLSLDLDEAWTAFDWTWQFRPGSTLAAAFPSGRPVEARLARLPDAPYYVAFAANLEGLALMPLIEGIASAFPTGGPWASVMGGAVDLMRGVTGMGSAWYVGATSPAGNRLDAFAVAGYYEVPDSADYAGRARRYIESLAGVSLPMEPGAGALTYEVGYVGGALTVDGVPVDTYDLRMRLPPGSPPMPFSEYGGYAVQVDPTHYLMTTTQDESLLRAALGTLRAGGGLGGRPEIAALRAAALTEPTVAEMFVDVEQCARGLGELLTAMGLGGLPLEPPAGLPPMAFFGHVADTGIATRTVLPHAVLRWFVQLGRLVGEPSAVPI